jgi:ABC-type branched-subunit amino acid transport system substrate-binding protein
MTTTLRRSVRKVLRIGVVAALALAMLGAGPNRKEERTWTQLRDAVADEHHERVLKLAATLIDQFPGSDYRLDAYRMSGISSFGLEQWRDARAHFETYLQLGGRQNLAQLQYFIALCLAREGRLDAAPAALRNVAVNDDDPDRSSEAARELVQLRLFEGKGLAALEAQGLLLERDVFRASEDLEQSRRAASGLSDEQLEELERGHQRDSVAGLAGFLLLERKHALLDTPESDPLRMSFARAHPAHFLLPEVPGAVEWAESLEGGGRKIGVLLPLSGRYAAVGELAQRGIELSLARAESLGWPKIELVTVDTQGDPEVAAEALRKLTIEEHVVAVLGPLLSSEGERLAELADTLGVPLMMMVQRPGLTNERNNVFNTWITAEEQVDALVEHAVHRMMLRRFAIAYPAKESSARLVARFLERAEQQGATVAAIESYEPAATDFRETARRIKGSFYMETPPGEADLILPFLEGLSKPQLVEPQVELVPGIDFEAVFVPDNYKRVSMLAPGFLFEEINLGSHLPAEEYPPVVLMGGAALNHPDLISRGGKYTEGTLLVDGFFRGSSEPAVREFALAYKAAYAKEPSIIEATAYDAALLAQQLLSDNEGLSRREFRRRLRISTPLETVTGARGIGSNGEMRHEMLCLMVRKGSIVQAWPVPPEAPTEATDEAAEMPSATEPSGAEGGAGAGAGTGAGAGAGSSAAEGATREEQSSPQ